MEVNEILAGLWKCEQEILDVIHDVCVSNNLKYTLAYGTLIGAVRHSGFIPWDDDIDIMMPREDYEKLLSIWNELAPDGYVLQNKRTNHDYSQNFTKIRKDRTAFIQGDIDRQGSYHKGIFVDIFPGDRVAPAGWKRKLQYIACAVNLLYSRGFRSGNGGAMGFVEKVLLAAPKALQWKLFCKTEAYIAKYKADTKAQYVFPCTIGSSRIYYPADMFSGNNTLSFNGKDYCVVKNPDEALRIEYGDYMQLPPESERVWAHHPEIVDFEHNYEELLELGKA